MVLPIIIFHLGIKPYVEMCLRNATKYNKKVILLTDQVNHYKSLHISNAEIIQVKDYQSYSQRFKYQHFSHNNPQLEYICIIRWMCIYEYMRKWGVPRAFICDSDVLIYDDLDKIDQMWLSKYTCGLCSSPSQNVTGGQSIWSLEKLQQFVIFIISFYHREINNMSQWFQEYKEPGGICDMTLLYYFIHNEKQFQGLRLPGYPQIKEDITVVHDQDIVIDLHMGSTGNHPYPDEWEMVTENGVVRKKITFKDGSPYCYNKRLQKLIRFVLLHFQGVHKSVMADYRSI